MSNLSEEQMNKIISELNDEEREELIRNFSESDKNMSDTQKLKQEKKTLLTRIKTNTLTKDDKYKILTKYPMLVINMFTQLWSNIGDKSLDTVNRFSVDDVPYVGVDMDVIMNVMYNTYSEHCTINDIVNHKRISKKEIQNNLDQYKKQLQSQKMLEFEEKMKYDGKTSLEESLSLYMEVIEMIRDKSVNNVLHAVQLMHTVSRIKKKMYLEDIEEDDTGRNPITLYLYGPQNYGKTILINTMFKKFSDSYIVCSNGTSEFNDNRQKKGILGSLVYFIEEMGTMNNTAMDNLKSWNTSNKDSYRKMYTNDTEELFIRTTFIGASNKPIDKTINDKTGMRRFWQIDYTKKINTKKLKQMEKEGFFDLLFSTLDEEGFDDFYEQYLPRIEKVQRSYVKSRDIFSVFKEDCDIETQDVNNFQHAVPSTYMYFAMLKFSYNNGFNDALKDIGIFIPSEDIDSVIKDYEEGDVKISTMVRKNTQTFANNIKSVIKPYGQGLSQYGRVSKFLITCNDELEEILNSMEGYMKIKKEGDEKLSGKKH